MADDSDPFAQYLTPDPQPAAPAAPSDDPFSKYLEPDNEPSGVEAFLHSAERSIAPALGGMAAAGAGAEVGALAGAPFGGVGAIPGAIIGGIGGAFLGSTAVTTAQDYALKALPESWQDFLGQDEKQQQAEATAHPTESFLGGLLPYALTMRPGGFKGPVLPPNATAWQRIAEHPLTSRLFSGALTGGMEVGNELASGQPIDPTKVAISTGFGLVFNKTNMLGDKITEMGARPTRAIATKIGLLPAPVPEGAAAKPVEAPAETPTPEPVAGEKPPGVSAKDWNEALLGQKPREPTVAQAMDAGVVGPGATEEVFMGAHQQAPEAQMTAQEAARATTPIVPTEPDVVATARRMEPEAFSEYDHLLDTRADLADRLAQVRDAEAEVQPAESAALQLQINAVDTRLREMGPDIAAAHRRAADAVGSEVIEPPAPPPPAATEGQVPATEPAPAATQAPIEQQAAIIAEDVTRQLLAAGRPEAEAHAAGQLLSRRYVTRAARLGNTVSPEVLYQSEGATIRAGGHKPPLMPTEARPHIAATKPAPAEALQAPAAPSVSEPAAATERPAPEGVAPVKGTPVSELESLDPSTIGVDAKRFQFKEGGDESGVTDRLQGVEKWDPRLAGTALVYRDAEGKNWIADGHQHLGLAKRLSEGGQPNIKLNAFVLDAATGVTDSQARAIAAIKNIAEGTGSAVDAAKVLREAKDSGIDLPPLPPRSTLVRDGRALAELSPEAFGMVVNEVIPANQGAMIGRLVKNAADQVEAARLLAKTKPDNAVQAEMMIRDMLESGTDMMKQESLFGEEAFASSVVLERAKLAEESLKQLRRDKSTFSTLVNEAERIQGHGANVLDQAANQSRLSTDEKAADLLTQLAFRAGPVSDELSAIARRLKAKEISAAEGAREFLGAIRRAVEGGVDTGAEPRGAEPGAVGERPLDEGPELFQPAPPIDTPEFNRWFGDSKVVDEHGAPLVVYHSTDAPKDFDKFNRSNYDIGMHFGTAGQAEDRLTFKSDRKDRAPSENQRMIPVYLSIKNPLRMEDLGAWGRDNLWHALRGKFDDVPPFNSTKDAREFLQRKGYDGIVYKNTGESSVPARAAELRAAEAAARDVFYASQRARNRPETSVSIEDQKTPEYKAYRAAADAEESHRNATGEDSYIAFDPTQIKSTFNRGTFDPKDPRILYQDKPELWQPGEMFGGFETERGLEGLPQTLIPGVKPLTDAERIAAAAAKPLKGGNAPPGDLFDETKTDQPSLFQQKRGSITFAEGKKPILKLFKDADASTFVHETGHQWLEELMRDSVHPTATDVLKDDAQTVRDWLGIKDIGEPIQTSQHEKFARTFEQYMREGVAPSAKLARVFAQFKTWLTSIYQTIKGLGSPINEDIRSVFDRMIETEPNRTVVAPERPTSDSLPALHETDAATVQPHEAEPAMDRVISERDRYLAEQPPEVQNEIAAAEAEHQATLAATEPRPEAGAGPGGQGEVVDSGIEPEPVAPGGPGSVEPGPELGGGADAGAKGTAEPNVPAEPGAGLRDNGSGAAGAARSQPLAPDPAHIFGPEVSPFIDKAGNIRIENLTTDQDVAQAIRDAAQENNDFIGDRRGVITDGQVLDLADALGMDAEKLNKRRLGEAFNAEQVIAARKLLIQSATDVAAVMKKAATGTDEDVLAYARARARHQMIQGQVAGLTAEAGRALRAFRSLAGQDAVMGVDQFIRDATGKTLFQLKEEAKMGALLDTPEKISKFTRDAAKRDFGGAVLEYWINGLVSGPRTHVTNLVGNTVMSLQALGPETAAAAAIGAVRRGLGREGPTVRMGEVGAHMRGFAGALPSATKAAIDALRTGRSITLPGEEAKPAPYESASAAAVTAGLDESAKFSDIAPDLFGVVRGVLDGLVGIGKLVSSGGEAGSPLVHLKYSPLGHIPDIAVRGTTVLPVGTAVRLPTRFLAAGDSFFRAANYTARKSALAYRTAAEEGLTGAKFDARVADIYQNPSTEVMEQSREAATELVFQSRRSEFVNALTRLSNVNVLGFPLMKFVVPFINTPANIIEATVLHRTPLGFLSPEIRADIGGKNGSIAQDTAMARMLVGSAYAIGFGALAARGLLTGSGPADSNTQALWRLAGNQAHSVRIGDMFYDVRGLGPLGMLSGIAADMYDISHVASEGDLTSVGQTLMHAFMQNILDASFMKGPSDLIQALEDPGRYGQSYLRSYASSFVPFSGAMGQTARAIDPYSRQARTVMDTIKAKVPGMSQQLWPRRDIWGEEMPAGAALGPSILSAAYATEISKDPVNIAMAAAGYWPGQPDRKIRGVQLTDEQYDLFSQVAGRTTKQRLNQIIGSAQWNTWPANVRHDVISETVRQSREAARGMVMTRYPSIIRDATQLKLAPLQGK